MRGFRDIAPKSDSTKELSGAEHTQQESSLSPEEYGMNLAQNIFPMAILASSNQLITEEFRLAQLFRAMKLGQVQFPEQMQSVIEDVVIQPEAYPSSRQVHSMFFIACHGLGITWYDKFSESVGVYVRQFSLPKEVAEQLMAEWGEDKEAMEFFGRCADFLRIE